jgi:hypothetical protein
MLGAMVLGVVAFTFANMAGSFAEQPTTGQNFDWDTNGADPGNGTIPYSPAYSQLSAAFNLQAEIIGALQSTTNPAGGLISRNGGNPVTAIYVVTEDMGSLPKVPGGNGADISTVANLAGVPSGRPTSSAQFYGFLSQAASGATMEAGQHGFSIYFISADNDVNMAIHCRVITSGTDTIYTVKTYSGGAFCPSLSYGFGVRNLNSSVLPSARQIKLRNNAGWGIDEDLGTQVVLPDPSVVAYQIAAGDSTHAFSRFAIFLPLKP